MTADHAPTQPLRHDGGTGTRRLPVTAPDPTEVLPVTAPDPTEVLPVTAPDPTEVLAPVRQGAVAPSVPPVADPRTEVLPPIADPRTEVLPPAVASPRASAGAPPPARPVVPQAAAPRPPARPTAPSTAPRPAPRATPPRVVAPVGPRVLAALTAVVAAGLVWVTWRLFVDTAAGQHLERAAFAGADYGQGRLWSLAEPVLDVVSATFVVGGLVVAMGIALLRRRWGLAVQVAFLVAGANVTSQMLKHFLLGRENLIGGHTWPNTLPSGHTTVAASVSVALLLVVPRAWRPLTAVLGAAYTGVTGVSTLIGQWHRPSDVVAALLVVLAWTAAVCALTPRTALDATTRSGGTGVVTFLLGAGSVAAGVAALSFARQIYPASWDTPPAEQVTAYIGGACGVTAATAAVFAAVLLVRQTTGRPEPPIRARPVAR